MRLGMRSRGSLLMDTDGCNSKRVVACRPGVYFGMEEATRKKMAHLVSISSVAMLEIEVVEQAFGSRASLSRDLHYET